MQMQHPIEGIEMQSHRHRLRTYNNCLVGNEIIDWLITRDKAADRSVRLKCTWKSTNKIIGKGITIDKVIKVY